MHHYITTNFCITYMKIYVHYFMQGRIQNKEYMNLQYVNKSIQTKTVLKLDIFLH